MDGIVYAGIVAAGFAFTENILYLGRTVVDPETAGVLGTLFMRGVASPFAHPLFTCMIGIGAGLAVASRSVADADAVRARSASSWPSCCTRCGTRRPCWPPRPATFFQVYAFVMLPMFVGLIVLVLFARRREAAVVTAELPGFAAAGWIAPSEVPLLADLSRRRGWRALVQRRSGRSAARAVAEYQAAVTELAFLRARIARGAIQESAAAEHDERLRAVLRARAKAVGIPDALTSAWRLPPPPGWRPPPPAEPDGSYTQPVRAPHGPYARPAPPPGTASAPPYGPGHPPGGAAAQPGPAWCRPARCRPARLGRRPARSRPVRPRRARVRRERLRPVRPVRLLADRVRRSLCRRARPRPTRSRRGRFHRPALVRRRVRAARLVPGTGRARFSRPARCSSPEDRHSQHPDRGPNRPPAQSLPATSCRATQGPATPPPGSGPGRPPGDGHRGPDHPVPRPGRRHPTRPRAATATAADPRGGTNAAVVARRERGRCVCHPVGHVPAGGWHDQNVPLDPVARIELERFRGSAVRGARPRSRRAVLAAPVFAALEAVRGCRALHHRGYVVPERTLDVARPVGGNLGEDCHRRCERAAEERLAWAAHATPSVAEPRPVPLVDRNEKE